MDTLKSTTYFQGFDDLKLMECNKAINSQIRRRSVVNDHLRQRLDAGLAVATI
ncbi:hypothetical protein [Prochlorococcus sp. MIT 1201]|uniref:hypothetical protein n=1 Tax=Prochlorococcus sp. MIT 1201 TaxID=3082535 RepID=UPI0039A77E7F